MFFACRGFAKYASSWPSFRCQHGFFFTKNEPKSNRKSTPRALYVKLVFYHPKKSILDRCWLPFWVQKGTQNLLLMLWGVQKIPWDQVSGCKEAPGRHQGGTKEAPRRHQGGTNEDVGLFFLILMPFWPILGASWTLFASSWAYFRSYSAILGSYELILWPFRPILKRQDIKFTARVIWNNSPSLWPMEC